MSGDDKSFSPLIVNESGIPDQLKQSGARWCVWKLETRNGKPSKVPYQSETRKGESNNPDTWLTYEQAIAIYRAGKVSGIGLYMGGGLKDGLDDLTGLDWDHLEESGISTDEICGIGSYSETSPSGTGARCFCILDKIPGSKKKKNNREIYKSGRFLTVTGHHIEGSPDDIRKADPEGLTVFYSRLCGEEQKREEISTEGDVNTTDRSEDEIIRIARTNPKFPPLWKGDMSAYLKPDGKPDHSSADIAMCNILAWASGKDPVMMDRVFRKSGLYRGDKWERDDYRIRTIQEAIIKCKSVYDPAAGKKKKQQIDDETGLLVRDDTPLSITQLNLTDIGNALRFQALYGDKFRFDFSKNTWYYWNDEIWLLDNNGCAKKAAQYTIAKMADEIKVLYQQGDGKHAELVFKHMKKSASERARNDMLKSAAPHMAVTPGIWNSKPELLNLQNGTLNLETLQFRGFNQEDYLTFKAGVRYDPGAKCPQWIDHLNLVFGANAKNEEERKKAEELISAFQLLSGYSLLSGNPDQVFFIPYGSGKNGKSVTINTLRMIMGDYGTHIAPQSLMVQKNPDKARSDLVRIQYKRLVTSSEGEQGAKLDTGWIKAISGGEPIVARALYQNEIEFRVEAVIWFATNHKPVINEYNEAIWRRIWLIPFNQVIPEEKRIVDYERKLIESEGSGILNWMLAGLKRYYEAGGLIKPKAITDATEEYKEDEDPIGDYLKENTVIEPGAKVIDRDLYTDYGIWCTNNGIKYCMSKNTFTRNLLDHPGITKGRTKSSRLYLGIRLKTDEDKKRESEEVTKDTLEGFV